MSQQTSTDTASGQNQTDRSPQKLRLVIVGGVAGGASTAARARRLCENAEITLIERGPDVSFANCGLPYYIGGEIQDRSRLAVQTPQSLQEMLNLQVHTRTEVVAIDRQHKTVRVRNLEDAQERELPYDKLLLAPGASPVRPPLPGIDHPQIHTLRNLADMDRIKNAATDAASVTIIGAGFIGLEVAEQMVHLGKQVRVVEMQPQVLAQMDREMVRPLEDELRQHGVELVLGDGIASFADDSGKVRATLKSGRELESDVVLLSIGVRPESQLAKDAGLELGARGHITVNEFQQTSDPDIYAVGDVVETAEPILGERTAIPLGGPANRQGRTAADHIFRPDLVNPYPGSLGTAIVRVFDFAAGVTGYTEARLKQADHPYETVTVTDYAHASYYPGAQHLTLKIVWDPKDGCLLGAQAVGAEGVDKRLDVLATALRARLTIDDLCHLELSYAPPFGSAKDVINIAGFAATNLRDGLNRRIELDDLDGATLLDVRPAAMAEIQPIPGARSIPLGELRNRLDELDRSKPVATICNLGKMSYFGARILSQNGFESYSVTGGAKVNLPKEPAPASSPPAKPAPAPQPKAEAPAASAEEEPALRLDASGLACPGPIMRVKNAVDELEAGQVLEVSVTDSGFLQDFPAFCRSQGHELIFVEKREGKVVGRLRKQGQTADAPAQTAAPAQRKGTTLVVFSQDLDKALASLVIANGALAMGKEVTLFFTFWGLNVLRKDHAPAVAGKTFMDKMFGWMMPRGVNRLPLSNMHMGGMGTALMKHRMASKNLPNLPDLLDSARQSGARLVACSMSMEAMGIRAEELIDGVEVGGVADFLAATEDSAASLFV
ncbi:MAG: FAD-dependent pyridine nucleotide-disulfide oxidoreductase [Puniceicoccaceae bacterium 5H]|nr:MAG: FAD-dependent pyridine nucleotide-disulfide oxidoreductase [Puniceicoccaceae bacterium 5H]